MLGRRLAEALKSRYSVSTAGRNGKADYYLDLDNPELEVFGDATFDALVHCAASFEGDTVDGAIRNEKINALGALYAGQLAARVLCRHVVLVSSLFAYKHEENEYYGSYAISKSHGEDNLRFACDVKGIPLACLRVSQIYDEHGEARRHQSFFYHIVDKASRGEDICFYGAKDRLRNYIYVGDVVSVLERVLCRGVAGDFPVIAPKSYTLTDIAKTAYEVFGTRGQITFRRDKPDVKSVHVPPLSDLYERLGFVPEVDLNKGIALIHRASAGETEAHEN